MSDYILEFETPLKDLESRINTLRSTGMNTGMDVSDAILKLEEELSEKKQQIYDNLSRWERVQLARHPKRPHSVDFINRMCSYWFEIHGDRKFADDHAMICGIGVIDNVKATPKSYIGYGTLGSSCGMGAKTKSPALSPLK